MCYKSFKLIYESMCVCVCKSCRKIESISKWWFLLWLFNFIYIPVNSKSLWIGPNYFPKVYEFYCILFLNWFLYFLNNKLKLLKFVIVFSLYFLLLWKFVNYHVFLIKNSTILPQFNLKKFNNLSHNKILYVLQ